MTAPCKECPNRKVGCHQNCPKYAEYHKERVKLREFNHKEAMLRAYCIDSHKRYKHG